MNRSVMFLPSSIMGPCWYFKQWFNWWNEVFETEENVNSNETCQHENGNEHANKTV